MKKIVVRIFNILFIGLAAYAAICFATQPILSFEVSATIKKETIGDLAADAMKGDEESEESDDDSGEPIPETSYIVRSVKRDGDSGSEFDIKNALSPEKIADSVGDITLEIPLEIEAKHAFDFKNEKVFNEILTENIKPVIEHTIDTITPKFKNLVKTVTLDFAKDVMKEQVANQVLANFGEDIPVDEQKINDLVDNVYDKLNKQEGETTTVKELSDAILGEKNYVRVENPSQEGFDTKTYYVKSGEEYVKAEKFEEGVEYFVESFSDGVCGILQDIQKQQEERGEPVTQIDFDAIDMTEIEDEMINALDKIPNLTQRPIADPQPTADNFGEGTYYIKDDLGSFVLAEEFKEGETYYAGEVTISSIDDALIGLLDLLAGKTNNSNPQPIVEENTENIEEEQQVPENAILRSRVTRAETEEVQGDRVAEKVKSVIYTLIPFDEFLESDLSLGGYAPLILFGIVLLGAIPWLFFILVSLIRTIRPRRCWTKTWIVLFFAFLQVIFGIGLTLGLKYAMPTITNYVNKLEIIAATDAQPAKTFADVVSDFNASIKTSAYIPSIIYLAFIPLSIIFVIVRHSVKRDFKQYKKDKKAAKHAPKAA